MATKRKKLPVDVKILVLHEAGYKCANPACRTILTLDIHHLQRVSDQGADSPDNLLALCPNCHTLHHKGIIPQESIRAWKMLLLAINEAYDRKTLDLLLALERTKAVYVSGDGLLACAALIASDLVEVGTVGLERFTARSGFEVPSYRLSLAPRGQTLLNAWKQGDQEAAVQALARG
jgi:hypothetical protein